MMKEKDRMQNRKEVNSLIATGTINAVKCSSGNAESSMHRLAKFWLADYCWRNNLEFATEVVFKNGQRADFLVKEWKLALEILGSESKADFLKKKYPVNTLPIRLGVKDGHMTPTGKEINKMMEDLNGTNGEGWETYARKLD